MSRMNQILLEYTINIDSFLFFLSLPGTSSAEVVKQKSFFYINDSQNKVSN